MAQTPEAFLDAQLTDVELPEGLAFELPEDGSPEVEGNDEQALSEFLREFEGNDEPLEVVELFPVDEDD